MTTPADTTTGYATPAQLAQKIADVCYSIATHQGVMTFFDHPVYVNAHAALRAAIDEVYGAELTDTILEVLVDCGESLEYCANIARERLADGQAHTDAVELETFLHALAAKLALTLRAVGGLGDHITKHDVTLTPSDATEVIFTVLAGDTTCGCGAEHPEFADATFRATLALVLGVDVPRISVLSNVSSVTS
jgi:hypothetical protein